MGTTVSRTGEGGKEGRTGSKGWEGGIQVDLGKGAAGQTGYLSISLYVYKETFCSPGGQFCPSQDLIWSYSDALTLTTRGLAGLAIGFLVWPRGREPVSLSVGGDESPVHTPGLVSCLCVEHVGMGRAQQLTWLVLVLLVCNRVLQAIQPGQENN